MEQIDCDFAIVGGGSTGCVLANRLSASGRHRVVLIEAGRDTPPDRVDPEILDSYPRIAYFNARNIWADLRVHLTPVPHNRPESASPRRYEQARLMGGGSSLNDMQANRGLPEDYDEWAAAGAKGWDWQGVLPFFKSVERDMDYGGPLHGKDGPIPIRRIFPDAWPPFSVAAAEAFRAHGHRALEDQNAEFEDGFFPVTISNLYDRRVSSAIGYLDNATRRRPNLTIIPDTEVMRLVCEGFRVTGLEAKGPKGPLRVRAGEVVVSAGGIHTPALLLRAGIGPAADLARLGIAVVADRPGVGTNLCDHPALSISAFLKRAARLPDTMRRHIHLALRYSSGIHDCPRGDMYVVAANKSGWHPVGCQIASLMTWVNKSYSRGRVSLEDPAPGREPRVEFNMLSDIRDTRRLIDAMRRMAKLFEEPVLEAVAVDAFPTSYSERIRDLGIVNTRNLVLTTIMAGLLDGPAWLRRALLRHVVIEDAPLERLLADEELLEGFVRSRVHGLWHCSCTCAMGAEDDPHAVVDWAGRVIGVEGLRVADTSVMPAIPRANTNLPTLMIGEKMSENILATTSAG